MNLKTKSIKKLIQLAQLYPDHWITCTIYTSSIIPDGIFAEQEEGKFNIPAELFAKIPIGLAEKNQKSETESAEPLTQEEMEILDAFLKAKELNKGYTFGKFRSDFKGFFPKTVNWEKISKNTINMS